MDVGTYGTGVTISFPTSDSTDLSKAVNDIVFFKPGGSTGDAEKQLTSVLLNAGDNSLMAFGGPARKKFAALCDAQEPT